jgi:hypothetical protein
VLQGRGRSGKINSNLAVSESSAEIVLDHHTDPTASGYLTGILADGRMPLALDRSSWRQLG